MPLHIDYLTIRNALRLYNENEEIKITMQEIANLLFCTPRNAKIILNKMSEKGWIEFLSGRGRGNTSVLFFKISRDEILFNKAKSLIENGNIQDGFDLIKQFGEGTDVLNRIKQWLFDYFGHALVEGRTNNNIELLRFPIFRKLTTMDPAESFFTFDSHIIRQVFEPLLDYEAETDTVKGLLAHDWEVDDKGINWTLHLRKGILLHNGRVLSAADVADSLERLKNQKYSFSQSWLMKDVEGVKVSGPQSIQVILKTPNFLFHKFLTHPATSIIPREAYDFTTGKMIKPIGTGPFKFREVTPEKLELCVHELYFRERAHLDKIEIITMPGKEFIAGATLNEVVINTGESTVIGSHKHDSDYLGCSILSMNLVKEGPLKSESFRRALDLMIDRNQLIDDLGYPRLKPANSFFYKKAEESNCQQLNTEKGYEGVVLSLYTYKRHEKDAFWLQHHLKQYGVILNVCIMDWKELLNRKYVEEANMILYEPVFSYNELSELEMYCHENSFLKIHLGNDYEIYKMIDNILLTRDCVDREIMFRSVEKKLKEERKVIFLSNMKIEAFSHSSVKGLQVNSKGWIDFKDVWFKQGNY